VVERATVDAVIESTVGGHNLSADRFGQHSTKAVVDRTPVSLAGPVKKATSAAKNQ